MNRRTIPFVNAVLLFLITFITRSSFVQAQQSRMTLDDPDPAAEASALCLRQAAEAEQNAIVDVQSRYSEQYVQFLQARRDAVLQAWMIPDEDQRDDRIRMIEREARTYERDLERAKRDALRSMDRSVRDQRRACRDQEREMRRSSRSADHSSFSSGDAVWPQPSSRSSGDWPWSRSSNVFQSSGWNVSSYNALSSQRWPVCGNGLCEQDEQYTCSIDCRPGVDPPYTSSSPYMTCGNGRCEAGEGSWCDADCGGGIGQCPGGVAPGQRFSPDGCNQCVCGPDGAIACTLMYCGPYPPYSASSRYPYSLYPPYSSYRSMGYPPFSSARSSWYPPFSSNRSFPYPSSRPSFSLYPLSRSPIYPHSSARSINRYWSFPGLQPYQPYLNQPTPQAPIWYPAQPPYRTYEQGGATSN